MTPVRGVGCVVRHRWLDGSDRLAATNRDLNHLPWYEGMRRRVLAMLVGIALTALLYCCLTLTPFRSCDSRPLAQAYPIRQ